MPQLKIKRTMELTADLIIAIQIIIITIFLGIYIVNKYIRLLCLPINFFDNSLCKYVNNRRLQRQRRNSMNDYNIYLKRRQLPGFVRNQEVVAVIEPEHVVSCAY